MTFSDLVTYTSGLIVGIIAAFIPQFVRDLMQGRQALQDARADLRAELQQNEHHQRTSAYITLEEDAFKRFRQAGYFDTLNFNQRAIFRELYSRIHEKNELITVYKNAIQSHEEDTINVFGGETPVKVISVISRIHDEIFRLIDRVRQSEERKSIRSLS